MPRLLVSILLIVLINSGELAAQSRSSNRSASDNTQKTATTAKGKDSNKDNSKDSTKNPDKDVTKDANEGSTKEPSKTSESLSATDLQNQLVGLQRTNFLLCLVAGFGLLLPVPLVIYHFRKLKALAIVIDNLNIQVLDQDSKSAQLDSVRARNEKLETEMKQMQERFRVTMRNAQDKHQESIDKLKNEIHAVELENKRMSGVLILKEQQVKKLSSGEAGK